MRRTEPASGLEAVFEEFSEQALSHAERKRDLELAGRLAAELEIDFADRGVIGHLTHELRAEALIAADLLFEHDPTDAVGIGRLQDEIRHYRRLKLMILTRLKAADDAARTIQEEYGNQHDDRYED